jgi:hypothetical protein
MSGAEMETNLDDEIDELQAKGTSYNLFLFVVHD